MQERLDQRTSVEQLVTRFGELINYNYPSFSELAVLEPDETLLAGADRFHGMEHAAGHVSMRKFLQRIPRYRHIQFAETELDIAGVGHDAGRIGFTDQTDHGLRGAEMVDTILSAIDFSESIDVDLVRRLIIGHSPGAPIDPMLPPYHQEIFKEADKIELARVERALLKANPDNTWSIDHSKLTLPESTEIFIPLVYAIYDRVETIKDTRGVNGFQAYLLAQVELGILRPE